MQWSLYAVGKLRPALRDLCDDYLKRLTRFAAFDEREVREAGRAGTEATQRDVEGRHLLDIVTPRAQVVLLDQRGAQWSSEELAGQVDRWQVDGRDRVFLIGGAVGIAPAVHARANVVWSLGPLTLPHELARVIVVEQLYRATTILRGEPYHKGAR